MLSVVILCHFTECQSIGMYVECHYTECLCWDSLCMYCALCWVSLYVLSVILLSVYAESHFTECHFTECVCWVSFDSVCMLIIVMYAECHLTACVCWLSICMLNVVMLSLLRMLSAIMLDAGVRAFYQHDILSMSELKTSRIYYNRVTIVIYDKCKSSHYYISVTIVNYACSGVASAFTRAKTSCK